MAPAPFGHRHHGATLVEVLVAMTVLSLGTAALLKLQRSLRLSGEQAWQQASAMRLAEIDQETQRHFQQAQPDPGVATPGPSWADISAQSSTLLEQDDQGRWWISRDVVAWAPDRLKAVTTRARWQDRDGREHVLNLHGMVAGIDPRLGAVATLVRDDQVSLGSSTRHPDIPAQAIDLDERRSAFKARPDTRLTWIFDRQTGLVTQRCWTPEGVDNTQISVAHLSGCTALSGWLVSGHLRFATQAGPLGPADTEQAHSPAMSLNMGVRLSSSGHPSPAWDCEDGAPQNVPPATTIQTLVSYHCVIQPAGTPPSWSGRIDVQPQGWAIGDAAGQFHICRYSADQNHNGRIDPSEHPQAYASVTGPLGSQNFLVVSALEACPQDSPGTPANPVDDSTVLHQP